MQLFASAVFLQCGSKAISEGSTLCALIYFFKGMDHRSKGIIIWLWEEHNRDIAGSSSSKFE